jgi:hypothetical protein
MLNHVDILVIFNINFQRINIQYTYTDILQIIVYILINIRHFFAVYQLCIKVANLVLFCIALVCFPDDDGPLWIETCRNI